MVMAELSLKHKHSHTVQTGEVLPSSSSSGIVGLCVRVRLTCKHTHTPPPTYYTGKALLCCSAFTPPLSTFTFRFCQSKMSSSFLLKFLTCTCSAEMQSLLLWPRLHTYRFSNQFDCTVDLIYILQDTVFPSNAIFDSFTSWLLCV